MATSIGVRNIVFEKVDMLLSKHLKSILHRELHNENKINLYSVGEYWAAFEKSAFLLGQTFDNRVAPVILHIKDYPFPVVMSNVHYSQVKDMCCTHTMAKKDVEFLQLLTCPIDPHSYNEWYRDYVIDENVD